MVLVEKEAQQLSYLFTFLFLLICAAILIGLKSKGPSVPNTGFLSTAYEPNNFNFILI